MTPKEIKAVFDRTFNGMPNPIFCYPMKYFEHNGCLCELASANKTSSLDFRKVKDAMDIFRYGLMVDDGFYVTVLSKEGDVLRDKCGHINSESELTTFLAAL